jgi:integrase
MSAGIRQGADFDVRKCRSALADVLLPMVWLGAVLGLRWSEVAGLRVGRLDVLRRTVTVAEAVTRDAQGRPVFTAPKSTAGARTLAMPAWLAEMLAEHLARLGTTAVDASELMFPAAEEGPLRYDNWRRRVWQPACVAASVGTVTKDPETKRERYSGAGFHDLRRANATGLVLAGVDLKTAQTRLGHSDPRLTIGLYAQLTTEADKAAAEALGARFSDASRDARGIGGSAP